VLVGGGLELVTANQVSARLPVLSEIGIGAAANMQAQDYW